MITPPFLTSPRLSDAGARHGFFSRHGGVSAAPFETLNTGPGSADVAEHIAQNRQRCAGAIGIAPNGLLTLHQVHSADAVCVSTPWADDARPHADGAASTRRDIALGVLTADCMPFLFYEPTAGIIGATHAGWRGALGGVLEATIRQMVTFGAAPQRIIAAVGPCLRPPDFETGTDLLEAFVSRYPAADRFFSPDGADSKHQLDLVAFGTWRLEQVGVAPPDIVGPSTLSNSADYFSYRASRRAGLGDYGRNLSAIALPA